MLHRTQELTDNLADLRGLPEVSTLQPIPESLLALSNRSMERLRGSSFNPRPVSLVDLGVEDGDSEENLDLGSEIGAGLKRTTISPRREPVQIAACDASSVKIGETETGMIFAIRAVGVWRNPDRTVFNRWGPLLFHISNNDDDRPERIRDDEAKSFGGLSVKTLRVLTRLRNQVERWTQEVLSNTVKDGVVLFDGSLTAGTPDNPASRVNKILTTTRANNSVVLALSKSTQLTVGGKNILAFFDSDKTPHLLDMSSIVEAEYPPYPVRFLGRVCVVKFSPDGFLFRLDIDRESSHESAMRALEQVAGTDVMFHGYPETLRLAHIYSTFTANEIIAIQRFVACNHRVSLQSRPSLRRSLFGPFGTSRYVA